MPKLEDHIDTPIKKCVAGLALLGFRPVFSCCGFTYQGEEVPKKHLPLKSYIYIRMDEELLGRKAALIDIILEAEWNIGHINPKMLEIYYDGFRSKHPWAEENSPHRAEMNVIGINSLEKVIDKKVAAMYNLGYLEVTLIDGNETWAKDLKYWQYPVCEPWKITIEVYKNL